MVVFRRKVSIRNGSTEKDRRVPLARLFPESCWRVVPPQEMKKIDLKRFSFVKRDETVP